MVEDKIIISEKKIDYILLFISVIMFLLSITTFIHVNLIYELEELFFGDVIIYDTRYVILSVSLMLVVYFFSFAFKIVGIILLYFSFKKILINKKYNILLFIIFLVGVVFNFIALFSHNAYLTGIGYLIYIFLLCLILIIVKQNNILSKLLFTAAVTFGVNIIISGASKVVGNIIGNKYMSSEDLILSSFSVAEFNEIIYSVNSVNSLILLSGIVLIIIYVIRCICKNNIFVKKPLNKLIPTIITVGSVVIFNIAFTIVYLLLVLQYKVKV